LKPRQLIVNVLSIQDLHAYADGEPIEIVEEAWGRVKVTVPSGVTRVEILYQPPWMRGVAMGGVLLAMGLYVAIRLWRADPEVRAQRVQHAAAS
jgi:hypothetical protein